MSALPKLTDTEYADALALAFPDVPPGHRPFGPWVIVQIRVAKTKSAGGIIIPDDARDTETDNTQVVKVVAIGDGCFQNRQTGEPWPEGPWFGVGDFVRSAKYGGDRWKVPFVRHVPEHREGSIIRPAREDRDNVEFAMFKDLDIRCAVTDPLAVKAYV